MFRQSFVRLVTATCMFLLIAVLPLAAADAEPWTLPRTAAGHPDFQGVWANNNATPLERPDQLADKPTLSEKELAAIKERAGKLFGDDSGDAAFGDSVFAAALSDTKQFTSRDAATGNYNQFWVVEREFSDNRTSLVIDPPNGRLPELTPEGKAVTAKLAANRVRAPRGPEDRSLGERCITFGVPRLGAGYNSYYQIVQTADTVAFVMEMIHDVRIIPLDGRPHIDGRIRQWHGDSRGRWEGDTLVVETRNYSAKSSFRGSSENLYMVERFTRVGPETLEYAVTLKDPTTWTRAWTAMIPLKKSEDAIYEYACHEGNISMQGMLAGARLQEAAGSASDE